MLSVILSATLALASDLDSRAPEPSHARLFVGGRGAASFPLNYQGIGSSFVLELGANFQDGNQLALRVAAIPDPPEVYGEKETPDFVAGPVVAYAYNIPLSARVDIPVGGGVGLLLGQTEDQYNKMMGYFLLETGLRMRVPVGEKSQLYFTPTMGFVPLVIAPTVGFSVGMLGAEG